MTTEVACVMLTDAASPKNTDEAGRNLETTLDIGQIVVFRLMVSGFIGFETCRVIEAQEPCNISWKYLLPFSGFLFWPVALGKVLLEKNLVFQAV